MKTAEADNKYQRILLLFDRFLQSTENQSLYTHWLIREKKLRFALLESYAKEHNGLLIKLLKVAKCPNCNGNGIIVNQQPFTGDIIDTEPCQWCDEKNQWINQQTK